MIVDAAPISLREATLTVDADDFTAAVNEVLFEPDVEVEWLPDIASGGVPIVTRVRWQVTIGVMQDLTAGSLTRYLLSNIGAMKTLVFTPLAIGPSVTAEVRIVPAQVGGPSGQILTASPTFPVVGVPVVDDDESPS